MNDKSTKRQQFEIILESSSELDTEESERIARQLRRNLLELDIDSLQALPAVAGFNPEGAKGADPITLGAWLMTLSASGGVLTSVISATQTWLQSRRETRRVTIKIAEDTLELGGVSPDEQSALIRAFLQKHGD